MSSRADILARVRRQTLPDAALPSLDGRWIRFADREKQFCDVLAAVGGRAEIVPDAAAAVEAIRRLPCFDGAQQIVSVAPGFDSLATFDLAAVGDPHALAGVDVAILPGEFAVAENAAVWVTDRGVAHRAVYFLTQHLVLVVPRAALLDNLHEAFERLRFDAAGYGLFISGPSKTADIEQSLVIGAHGPRSLTVLLVGS